MSILEVIILSFIEGLTEFLPVSSTGHLIIVSSFLNMTPTDFSKAFDVIIQFGAILAVVLLYRKQLNWDLNLYKKLLFAFIPAAALGFLFKNKIDFLLESTTVVAWALIIGGAILIVTDYILKNKSGEEISEVSAWKIGFFQCLALIPGVSRSAATILGGQLIGLSKQKAAEFSFLLAIPTLGAATFYKLWKVRAVLESSQIFNLVLGVTLSFVFALLAIQFFIKIVSKYGFKYFGIYRIILGVFVLVVNR